MKYFYILSAVVCQSILLCCLNLLAQVNQEWVARYDGGHGSDEAHSIAVDGSGNVFVTGTVEGSGSDDDLATIKYNSSGVQQWLAQYNGPFNGVDQASSIALDSSGNVYITGRSMAPVVGYDYATIKYNSSGIQQWIVRYNGPGNNSDIPTSIAVDGAGNVYVTGASIGSGTLNDFVTIKYNTSGVQQWLQRYNGPGNSNDEANSLAVDSSGNVYVTGASYVSSSADYDYATIKYNSSGVQQWVKTYNGPGSGTDRAAWIVVDGTGNVYLTGRSRASGTNDEYATIKYNSSGVQQWVVTY